MKLVNALRLNGLPKSLNPKPSVVAFVGAGGKTSTMFCLGNELLANFPNVFLTCTTHLSIEQTQLAAAHLILNGPDSLALLETELPPGIILLTGSVGSPNRVDGLNEATINRLALLAQEKQIPMLVEADGSRRRPLKAPADHEPVIPAWVELVVVVAGLAGLGEPLSEKWVHRPERFSALSGIPVGEEITPEGLVRVLASPEGGLKNIPSGARKVVLLNGASTPGLAAQANRLAGELLAAPGVLQAVLVANIAVAANPAIGEVLAVHEPVAGIILAAGSSQRMVRSLEAQKPEKTRQIPKAKQLLLWKGEPLVRHVARTALQAGLSPVVVVVADDSWTENHSDDAKRTDGDCSDGSRRGMSGGSHPAEIEAALRDLPVQIVVNPAWATGQSSSLQAGLQALPSDTGAAVFLLADQPQIPPSLVRALVELHAQTLSHLVAPQIRGQRANPVLFDRSTIAELMALSGDAGGRSLFSRYPAIWLPWVDESLLLDVDTLDDYERLLELG